MQPPNQPFQTFFEILCVRLQEPEDDPRNFCYVWSVQGDNDFDTEREKSVNLDSKATATLHALSFRDRRQTTVTAGADDGGGSKRVRMLSYSQISSCSPRFAFTLDSDKLDSDFQVPSVCTFFYFKLFTCVLVEKSEHRSDDFDFFVCNFGEAVVVIRKLGEKICW